MRIPATRLVPALEERLARRRHTLTERDRRWGATRCRVFSYMENIGWPPLFGYDMNRFYGDPAFMFDQELRQRIFWLDNSAGDDVFTLELVPTTGFYWDITLFGQQIRTQPDGVPQFLPHPLASSPDLSLIARWNFHCSGDMPVLLQQHRTFTQISADRCDGRVTVGFPRFRRGPLDILIQMRGYENFVADIVDRPEFVHAALARIVGDRARWTRERAAFLDEEYSK